MKQELLDGFSSESGQRKGNTENQVKRATDSLPERTSQKQEYLNSKFQNKFTSSEEDEGFYKFDDVDEEDDLLMTI